MWDIYLSALALTSAMGRLIALPPHAPAAAVDALRDATAKLNNDPAFAEESMKALGFVPDYVTGPDINRLARQTLTVRRRPGRSSPTTSSAQTNSAVHRQRSIGRRRLRCFVHSLLAAALGDLRWPRAASPAPAQEPFYKGKRLTVLINFDAGSATDIEGRVFARHFAKHIEGPPQLIVQNIAGGGGINGTQYLGEVAPKDGTMMGYITATAWNYASQPQLFRVDFRTYEFIGYQGGTAVYYVRTDVPPGIKQSADIVKAQGLVSGGVAATTGRDLGIRLTPRHARRAVQARHRLSQRRARAARAAAERNPSLCRHDARLSRRGRADDGEGRAR